MISTPYPMRWYGRDGRPVPGDDPLAPADSAPLSLLIVEDDPDILAMLALALEIEGYTVATCADGAAALRYLATSPPPSCILLDLRLPTIDGATLRQLLRRKPRWANIPVVLMSAYPHGAMMATTLDVPFFEKPFEIDDLVALVGRLCGR